MTVTPARTPAPSRLRARVWAHAIAGVATTLLLLGAATVPTPAATSTASDVMPATAGARVISAATPTPTPSPTTSGRVDLTLAPAANGIVRAGDALSVSVIVANGTANAIAPVRITLSLGATRLADRAALTTWLHAPPAGGPAVTAIGTVNTSAIAAGSSDSRSITIAPTDAALANRAAGVYPLIASYTDASGTVSSTSAMIVPDTAAAATAVGVVVPITGPATGGGLLTAAQLTELTAPGGALTNQLDAVAGTPAILAIDPAIPAAIRVLGTAAPARALAWLARLDAMPNTRFALQFGDADVAAQIESGVAAPQKPLSLQAYMTAPNFATAAPDASPSPSPSPTATSGPTYPSLTQLLDVGGGRSDVYWPASGSATSSVLTSLAGAPSSTTLVPSATLAAGANGATVTAHATAGTTDLLVYDSEVSAALHAASVIDTTPPRGAPLTAAAAYLAFAAADAGGRPRLVTVDRASDRSAPALSAAVDAVQASGLTLVGLDGIATATPTAAQVVDPPAEPARVDAASALAAGEARVAAFATILDDPALLTGPQRAQTLQLLGNAWRSTPDAWQTALAANSAATGATLDSVGTLAPATIQLLSPRAPLQFWVRNDLPYPVNVVLRAAPDDLRLDVQTQTVVIGASPRSNTRIEVPVTAHVGNAQVGVDLQLRSPTGQLIGAPQRADITVRADWEGIGVTSLLVIIAALAVIGLVRTILRRRRARRERTTDAGAPA